MDMYNRHRPRTFKKMYNTSPFVQKAEMLVHNTLEGKKPDLPHFLIFHSTYGGVGKTTAARLLAVGLNPDMSERDRESVFTGEKNEYFFEINGAVNGKKDDARELDKKIEYKRNGMFDDMKCIFMINEAHQLTKDAQEVFLQLTENIPKNIYIIFTSTDLVSFNDKLRGRAQVFEFTSFQKTDFGKLLGEIALKETGQQIDPNIIDVLFEQYGFSVRESINNLGKYIITGQVPLAAENDSLDDHLLIEQTLRYLEDTACGISVRWSQIMVPHIYKLMKRFSPEEVKQKLLHCLAQCIMSGMRGNVPPGQDKQSVLNKKIALYTIIGDHIVKPLGYPPQSYMIVLFFRLYIEAQNIAKRTFENTSPAEETRGTYATVQR